MPNSQPPMEARPAQIAAHTGAALFDLSSRAKVMMSGPDAPTLLQNLATADIASLPVYGACYTAFLNPTGHVLADAYVHRTPDGYLLHTEPELRERLPAHIRRYVLRSKVALTDVTDAWALILVVGPLSDRAVSAALRLETATSDARRGRPYDIPATQGKTAVAFGWHIAGGSGVGLLARAEAAPILKAGVLSGGAVVGTDEDLDVLRVEAGTPLYGRDMDETTLALEARLERAISETKGCYIGQEVVARIAARGHCNRLLVGLLLGDADPKQVSSPISVNNKEVGRVTSVVQSPWLGQTIALAYVRREWASPGSAVRVGYAAGTTTATVSGLPFAAPTDEGEPQ